MKSMKEIQLKLDIQAVKTEELLEGTVKELFGLKVYRQNILIMITIWSFGSFAFFMVPFYLQNIQADIFFLSMATECAEFLASIACVIATRFLPLKKALLVSCVLISVGSFAMMFIAKEMASADAKNLSRTSEYFNTALILITNFGIVCAFDIAYLINAELFPTILLSTAYGACNILGRLISIMAPIAANMPQPYPLLILFIFSVLCAILSQMLIKVK